MSIYRPIAKNMKRWQSVDDFSYMRLHQNESATSLLGPEEIAKVLKEHGKKSGEISYYPYMQSEDLAKAYAQYLNVPVHSVLLTQGSGEGIILIAEAIDRVGKSIAILAPSFFAFEFAFAGPQTQVVRVMLDQNLALVKSEVFRPEVMNAEVLILCRPNNPTGGLIPRELLIEILDSHKGMIIVDEAYMEYVENGESVVPLIDRYENLVILRTMSKAWGLAALRVGFIVANPKLIEYFGKFQLPYSVSMHSQILADYVLRNRRKEMEAAVKSTIEDRDWFEEELAHIPGLRVFKSQANFCLFAVQNGAGMESKLFTDYKILVKCFPLPKVGDCIRLSISVPRKKLKEVLSAIADIQVSQNAPSKAI